MNTLLIFFAFPVATIILAIVLEKILRCPFLTAATFFAIFLIVAFAAFDADFLVNVIVYTILAFLAAVLAEIFYRRNHENNSNCSRCGLCHCRENNRNTITLSSQDIARIANEIANIQNNNNNTNNGNNSLNCNCNNNNNANASDVATVNVTNNTTGGKTSWCCYRR